MRGTGQPFECVHVPGLTGIAANQIHSVGLPQP